MERTGLPYFYAGQIFRDRARELGMSLEAFGSLCENDPSYDIELDERMLNKAREGDAILEGRMIGALCWRDGIQSFKVYVDADSKVRASRIMEREGGDIEAVFKGIIDREASERKRYMALYGIDHMDRKIYDLWVDSSNMTPDHVVSFIMKKAGI